MEWTSWSDRQKDEEFLSRFRKLMSAAGFTISGDDHAISPVMLGDAKLASDFADRMLKEGIYVIGTSVFLNRRSISTN